MLKILYCGDVGCQTGFGRVAEYLVPALAKEYEVHALAVNWHGDPSDMQQHCSMYPAMAHGTDPFGNHRISELVQKIKPDLIWVTNDLWIGISLWQNIKELKESLGFKFFVYTPIDSYGLFPELNKLIEDWDGLATYTEFAKAELVKMGYNKPIHILPHGTDFTKFFSMDKSKCREDLGVPQDAFIVFNGNRNQPRKRIDLTIKAFIKFAKDKPDARLWLNMGSKDTGWELIPLFKRIARDENYDSKGKLILTSPHFSIDNCLSIEELNKVYNACDIGVNSCIGEGWGLVNTEHGATGVAQLVPDHTSLKEIFCDIQRIQCHGSETDTSYGLERMLPEPQSMADILDYYYHNREALHAAGQWCKSRLHEEQFTWPVIVQKALLLVEETLKAEAKQLETEVIQKPRFKGFEPMKIA